VPSTSAKIKVAIRKKAKYEEDVEQTSSDSGSDMNSTSASSDNENTDNNTSSKQHEDTDTSSDENEGQTEESAADQQVNKGSWIVAEYRLTKSIRWYAGQVTDKSDDGLHVKFLPRKISADTALKTTTFQWPSIDDSDVIEQECVKQILSEPTTDRRGSVNFSDNFLFQCS